MFLFKFVSLFSFPWVRSLVCTLFHTLSTYAFIPPLFFVLYVPTRSKVKISLYTYYYTVLLAVVELPQLPHLLLLK